MLNVLQVPPLPNTDSNPVQSHLPLLQGLARMLQQSQQVSLAGTTRWRLM